MVLVEAQVMDSTHLKLARPIATRSGGTVLVVVAESRDDDAERRQWIEGSADSLADAYGDAEPDYPPTSLKERNPDFAA